MMQVIPVILACLTNQPAICDSFPLNSVDAEGYPMTLMSCMTIGGQVAAQEWLKEHTNYTLKKIRCAYGNYPDMQEKALNADGQPI